MMVLSITILLDCEIATSGTRRDQNSTHYDTTAISLSYVMYCLPKNPRCQERYCEEARRVVGKRESENRGEGMEEVDDDNLTYCPTVLSIDRAYCRAVLTESI